MVYLFAFFLALTGSCVEALPQLQPVSQSRSSLPLLRLKGGNGCLLTKENLFNAASAGLAAGVRCACDQHNSIFLFKSILDCTMAGFSVCSVSRNYLSLVRSSTGSEITSSNWIRGNFGHQQYRMGSPSPSVTKDYFSQSVFFLCCYWRLAFLKVCFGQIQQAWGAKGSVFILVNPVVFCICSKLQ